MAGLSRRFADAGYGLPKYMLPLGRGYCFDRAVAGFLDAYGEETFLFVCRGVAGTPAFVEERCRAMGLRHARIVVLDGTTSGQGETVERGLDATGAESGEIAIFNVDTFRENVVRPPAPDRGDGWLEVVRAAGDGWSFVLPAAEDGRVSRTTEKERVSDLCCTGFYGFRSADDFRDALETERSRPSCPLPESYIAPIYNHLIAAGRDIRYVAVERDDVTFCGTPAEYEAVGRELATQ